jgi:hypothetical protein
MSLKLPSIKAVRKDLAEIKSDLHIAAFPKAGESLAIRLFVNDEGQWHIDSGDPRNDSTEPGWRAEGTVTSKTNCEQLAIKLLNDLRDQQAEAEAVRQAIDDGAIATEMAVNAALPPPLPTEPQFEINASEPVRLI